ncbi:MAG: gluconokinase [Armatimonadota bacterium]
MGIKSDASGHHSRSERHTTVAVPTTDDTSTAAYREPFVLAVDVGTSSVRASIYDGQGRCVAGTSAAEGYTVVAGPDGAAELDAEQLLQRAVSCMCAALANAPGKVGHVSAVAVSTFWHSVVGVGSDGRAVTPIYMWMDTRSWNEADEIAQVFGSSDLHQATGCMAHPSYLPAKLLWVKRHEPSLFRASRRWLSPGEYIHLRLLGRAVCSVSMASGTGLFDIRRCDWHEPLLSFLGIKRTQLSPLGDVDATIRGVREEFAGALRKLDGAQWLPAVGDGACSNVGIGCVRPNRIALMVGTSGAMRVGVDPSHPPPPYGLWRYAIDRKRALVGGALSNGGNLVAWLRSTLNLSPEDEAEAAGMEPDSHGLTFVPLLAGERSPGWANWATGLIAGLTLSTRPSHILRAAMEAVACRFAVIHELLWPFVTADHEVIATGRALLSSPAWMQMMADALNRRVVASAEPEASRRGAALLALEVMGAVHSLEDVPAPVGEAYDPEPARHQRYRDALGRQKEWYRVALAHKKPPASS